MSSTRSDVWLLSTLVAFALSNCSKAANFLAADAELVTTAEAAREHSARFWTGAPLPGNWSRPCPITARIGSAPGSGLTRFSFADGEVFNWQMEVQGNRAEVLNDVIPHEVDHMVRATLVRRPIVRWLDEGCATLFESTAPREKLRARARMMSVEHVDARWLTAMEYPGAPQQVADVYILGFAFVEFLLLERDAATLLALQQSSPQLESTFLQLYGFPLTDLPRRWQRQGRSSEIVAPPPRLRVWTANWCGPCQLFKRDLERNAEFRTQLTNHFQIEYVDFDQQIRLAVASGVRSLPAFQTENRVIIGYSSPNDLLARLGIAAPIPAKPLLGKSPQLVSPPTPEFFELPQPEPAVEQPEPLPSPPVLPVDPPTRPPPVPRALTAPRLSWIPVGLTVLQWTGILGGTAFGGGIGGIALSLMISWLKTRQARRSSATELEGGSGLEVRLPFPRRLEEAGQLLELRKSEGRVAVLDALRGMFLDDELEKLRQSPDLHTQSLVQQLQSSLDQRVTEVAPLSIDRTV